MTPMMHINGVPVSIARVGPGYVATVGVFGLVSTWAGTAHGALAQAVRLLSLAQQAA